MQSRGIASRFMPARDVCQKVLWQAGQQVDIRAGGSRPLCILGSRKFGHESILLLSHRRDLVLTSSALPPRSRPRSPAAPLRHPQRASAGLLTRLLPDNDEMSASILRPTVFAAFVAERRLFAEATHLDSGGIDAEIHEVLSDHRRSPLPERQVVFPGSALVTMAVDTNRRAWPLLQPSRVVLQRLSTLIFQRVLVEVEKDIRQRTLAVQLVERLSSEEFLVRGCDRRGRSCSRRWRWCGRRAGRSRRSSDRTCGRRCRGPGVTR